MEKLTLGQYFRNERERLGISLKDIELRTKIPSQTLIWLENDNTEVLPPRAFLRGFLQVISKEFGMDEDELFRLMDESVNQNEILKSRSDFREIPSGISRKIYYILAAIVIAVIIATIAICAVRYTEVSLSNKQNKGEVLFALKSVQYPDHGIIKD